MEHVADKMTMKTSSDRSGIALVIVLGFLTLLSVLAIAFFSSITTETKASRNFTSRVSTRQLADTAVNLVMSQIREATALPGAAWASQPGMIRVYRDGRNASSKADSFFKLYSARNMVVSKAQLAAFDPESIGTSYGADHDGTRSDIPVDWDKYPSIFSDLNNPVLIRDAGAPGSALRPVFPILDPRARELIDGKPLIEGFDFSADIDKVVTAGASDSWRIPMPTRWIYVLRDGTLTTPDSDYTPAGGGTGCEWKSGSPLLTPTKENPIVGRIAFWADDDTSKININTAGGPLR